MSQELAVIGIIVFGEKRNLFGFADIVADGSRDKKISFQYGIGGAVVFTEFGYAQCMFQQASHKAVVYGFGGGGHAEGFDEGLVFQEKAFQELFQVLVFHTADKAQKLFIHVIYIFGAYGKVVGRIVFSLFAEADSFHAHLQSALKAVHIAVYLNVVQSVKFGNSRAVGIPYFGVYGAGFILKDHIIISFSVFGNGRLFMFTEVNVKYSVALF